jgi:hypothetical protein
MRVGEDEFCEVAPVTLSSITRPDKQFLYVSEPIAFYNECPSQALILTRIEKFEAV